MKETQSRSIVKALTWRVIAFISLLLTVLLLGGKLTKAIEIGLVDQAIKLVIHYTFERGWNKIKWGYIQEESRDIESVQVQES